MSLMECSVTAELTRYEAQQVAADTTWAMYEDEARAALEAECAHDVSVLEPYIENDVNELWRCALVMATWTKGSAVYDDAMESSRRIWKRATEQYVADNLSAKIKELSE